MLGSPNDVDSSFLHSYYSRLPEQQNLEICSEILGQLSVPLIVWQWNEEEEPAGLNAELRLASCNSAALEILDFDLEMRLGQSIRTCFPSMENDLIVLYGAVAQRVLPAQHREVYYEDGQIQGGMFAIHAFPLPYSCVGISFENITLRKQIEWQIKENEKRFRAVFEQAAIGLARLSPEGQWLAVNQTFCDLLGYRAAELTGLTFREITHPADHTQDEQFHQQLLRGEIEECALEKRYIHREGHSVWVSVTVSTVRADNGSLDYFIISIADITSKRQARLEIERRAQELNWFNQQLTTMTAKLQERNEELDQFAYVASHDLKAPLRAIASLAEWIAEDAGPQLPPESQGHLSLMQQRIHRLEGLLAGLLDYSRVGRANLALTTIDVSALIQEVIDSLAPSPQVQIQVAPNLPVLRARRVSLLQVFTNLLSNAIKYGSETDGAQIEISVRDRGEVYEFSVRDHGPGIDPRFHHKIFGIFQTLQSRDQVESSGVGLAIVKKIIETEQGEIQVISALGQGTTFRFTWPKQSLSLEENSQDESE